MGISSKLKSLIGEQRVDDIQQQLQHAMDQGFEKHIRIAVTGLSRSGKTVFITALTHHLLNAHKTAALPFLSATAEGRVLSVKMLSDDKNTPFPIKQSIANLQEDPPTWPKPSTGLSTIRLAIRYHPKSRLKKLFSDTSTLYLDIIDYPGEWLLDLPLLQMDFQQWCAFQSELFTNTARAPIAKSWLEEIAKIDWQQPAPQHTLDKLSQQYKQLLAQIREQGLSLLQPGRMVLPETQQDSESLLLFPLIGSMHGHQEYSDSSGYKALENAYRDYRDNWVKPFYRQHFSQFDRQIVLVDCLKALNQGKDCFDDMQLALTTVLQSFHYGQATFLRRLFKPRIDKVLFAATKADHVTPNQHHNLDQFLQLMIDSAQRELSFDGIETLCLALSSIRSTKLAQAKVDGQQLSCLQGYDKASGKEIALFPGEVPTELPTADDWNSDRFQFVDFAPKRLPQQSLTSEHHIRLDQALAFLIGDDL